MLMDYDKLEDSIYNKFRKEYELLSMLDYHENIIQLLKIFIAPPTQRILEELNQETRLLVNEFNILAGEFSSRPTLFIAMEYYPTNLENYLKDNRTQLNMKELISICTKIGYGLDFLFNNNVVHRDIKLNKILMNEDGIPIICDFGYGFKFEEERGEYRDISIKPIGGNLAHLAPEILNKYEHFKDTTPNEIFIILDFLKQPSFEFGVICHEILCDQHPFGDYPGNYSFPIILNFNSSLISSIDGIPEDLITIITNLLQNDPHQRPFISDILSLLENIMNI